MAMAAAMAAVAATAYSKVRTVATDWAQGGTSSSSGGSNTVTPGPGSV